MKVGGFAQKNLPGSTSNVIKLRNLCHSEVAQQPWESVFKRHYGLPRRFAPRNDNLNLMTLRSTREILF